MLIPILISFTEFLLLLLGLYVEPQAWKQLSVKVCEVLEELRAVQVRRTHTEELIILTH